jgi:hypothetical protein
VNGSEVTAMLAEDSMVESGSLAPDGGPWQDASLWHAWHEKASAAQHVGLAVSGMAAKTGFGNGHEPQQALSAE